MSEGHGDPPADVRSFLPRPGEPVEQYAERLRALHRDLTLVLQAVERGLAAAAEPDDLDPPVPSGDPIEIVPETPEEPAPARTPPAPPAGGRMPRVEVLPPPSGEERRFDGEERRRPPEPAEPADPREPAPRRRDGDEDREPPRPGPRLPPRPSVAAEAAYREPEWVDRGTDGFTAPTFPAAPPPQRLTVSPLVATAFLLAWLVVVALLVALLVS